MTKETKIGLLVGLTFIILFAIILSKKGPGNTKAPLSFTVADSGAADGTSPLTGVKPLDRAGKVSVERELPAPAQTEVAPPRVVMLEEPVGQEIPDEDEPIRPLPESVVSRLNIPMIEVPVNTADVADPEDDIVDPVTDAVVSALNGTPSGAGAAPAGSDPSSLARNSSGPAVNLRGTTSLGNPAFGGNQDPMGTDSHLASSPANGQPNRSAEGNTTPPKPMTIVAVHEVQSGESLGKIAAKHYGRATPSRIEAIFNANRDQLESVDAVKANTKLNIPLLEGEYAGMFESVDRLSPPALNGAGGANRTDNLANSGSQRNAGTTAPRRDETVRIPIPVDGRTPDRSTMTADASRGSVPAPANRETSRARPIEPAIQFSWYEVRDKDTLSKIARKQLGSEARFREIYKINQDIIPDVHKLKPGMKIRVPAKGEPTRSSSMARESLAIEPSLEQ